MTKHRIEKEDVSGLSPKRRLMLRLAEAARLPELPQSPRLGKGYEIWPAGTVCADGTPYHGCLRLGCENKLMIAFSGGGVSVNEYTAARPQRLDADENSEMFYSERARFGDLILSRGVYGRSRKNSFRDWNVLFVPYASGDFHCGTADFPYTGIDGKPHVLHHHGYINFHALLDVAKRYVGHPDQIIVTGFSAGAFATGLLCDDICAAFPECHDVTACLDSALMHYDWNKTAHEVWKAPKAIADRLTGDEIVTDSLLALHEERPSVKILYCCSVRDAALTQMEAFLGARRWIPTRKDGEQFQESLLTLVDRLTRAIPDAGLFIFDMPDKRQKEKGLTQHCISGGASFDCKVDGYSYEEWLAAGVNGKPLRLGMEKLERKAER